MRWSPRLWCGRRGTWRHPPSFHVAGVVLGDIDPHFVWQAWHVWHWAGSGGALGPEWQGMAPRLLAWQAWHFETSTFVSRGRLVITQLVLTQRAPTQLVIKQLAHTQLVITHLVITQLAHTHFVHTQLAHTQLVITHLRGRRGTYGIGLAPVARLGRSGRFWRRGCWRGRRGTLRHPPSFHVADVALGDMDLHFAWQARHLATCIFTLRGRRGTYGIGLAPVARLGRSGRFWRRGCWRGKCGTLRHPPSFHVAGVVLDDIHLSRGRRGTW